MKLEPQSDDPALVLQDLKLWKLKELQAQVDEYVQLASIETNRITSWMIEAVKPLREQIASVTNELTEFHKNELELDPKKTSISLPHGKLTSRNSSDRVEVENLELYIKWAHANDRLDLVRIKEEPDLVPLKKAVWENGVEAEGIKKIPRSRTFSVEV